MHFEVHTCQGVVVVETSGVAAVDGFQRFMQAVIDHPDWERGVPILLDHSRLDLRSLSHSDLRDIGADGVALSPTLRGSKVAVVLPDDLSYGLGRVWQTQFFLLAGSDRSRVVQIFRSRDEALDWLQSANTADR